MLDKDTLSEVLAVALANGGDFADVFVEYKKLTGIGCEDGKIERIHSGIDSGAGIRVLLGDITSYAYTNDLSREGLLKAATIVSHAVAGQGGEKKTFVLQRVESPVKFEVLQRPDQVSTEQKVHAVRAADEAARIVDRSRIKQVMVGYSDIVQRVTIANSRGYFAEDERIRTRLMVNAVASEGAVIQTGYEAVGSHSGFELLERYKPEEVGAAAARRAVQMLTAKPAPAGKMPVVLAGEAGGTMVHEACGHGLEADLVQKGLSVYAGKIGRQVAASCVTVVDDATLPDRYGSYSFDDEGVPARKVVLIENGILKDFLYDRLTAHRDGVESNGHGRRESYQHKPIPRMGNTFITPGQDDPAQIIRDAGNGLLVKKMGGGQVNTTTGDFVFDVAEGYLIENGAVGPLVRGATLTGNGPAVLRLIEAVGSDLGFTIGTCGKDGQGVPVSDAQPTIRIKELVVGGTGHGE
ncbi:protease TldD [Sporotomaculum syntrophicum]|uniref:Protease TldD n=1 Tax=Sporotomaculum syntrophicum TaxID=182264 RepID=A0A9D2WSH1_9FIRM|nr:TldD/PmbA family protein [Sporotomaculum syntrophicum]KAF1086554.1 protease TldD [Sporotomaculum syntrophicum]